MTDVIATEDWATHSPDKARQRLTEAERRVDAGQWPFSRSYHKLWHGDLNGRALDEISATRPIAVWLPQCRRSS